MDNKKNKRQFVQLIWFVLTNSYITGFLNGKIYRGKLKNLCVPGLNCYSCPGALGSCPIGSLQALIGSWKYNFSFYVVGFLMLIGVLCGRFVCGWLCPFGLLQDLLHKIPFKYKIKTFKLDKSLRYLKYIILVVFVIILPIFITDIVGQGSPFFCKFLCPVGTIEGGWPLVLMNKPLQATVGLLYLWKNIILIILLVLSIIIYRPFCKYICPLGAIYSVFNNISFYNYKIDKNKCTKCGICSSVCKMTIEPYKTPNNSECIRCGDCKNICPNKAINN